MELCCEFLLWDPLPDEAADLLALDLFPSSAAAPAVDAPRPHPGYSAVVIDTIGLFAGYLTPMRDSALVAARNWLSDLIGQGTIDIEIRIAQTPSNTANGGAGTYNFVSTTQLEGRSTNLYEPGTLTEVRTGIDRNGAAADIVITVDPDRLNTNFGSYWFDPNPFDADHRVPANLSDGLRVMTHEIGHALGMIGYRDWSSYSFTNAVTRFDTFVSVANGEPFFTGPQAMAAYGGPVPLTPNNLYHYGTGPGGVGILGGIMNGISTPVGTESRLEALDFAIMADLGYTLGSFGADIYRFFNTTNSSHFYTASIAERDNIIAQLPGLRYEGPAFEAAYNGYGDLAVHRFLNTTNGSHFYTADAAEKALIQRTLPGYTYEGAAYGAYTNDDGGEHTALYRFFRPENGTHFYTASAAERDNVMATLPFYQYEGVAFYIDSI